MMLSIKNIIYSQTNIDQWNEKLPALENEITVEEESINSAKSQLRPLNRSLDHLQIQIDGVEAEIFLLQRAQQQRQHSHHHHSVHFPLTHHHHNDGDSAETISRLQTQLAHFNLTRQSLRRDIASQEVLIKASEESIQNAQQKCNWIKEHTKKAQQFLQTLKEQPDLLVKSLHDRIFQKFFDYEYNHPAGLSPRVRFCLLNFPAKLQELAPVVTPNNFPDSKEFDFKKYTQINYLRLCGFIWEMYSQVKKEGTDEKFTDLLIELINELHIDENGDLPDELHSGSTAKVHFQDIKNQVHVLSDLTDKELLTLESTIFKTKLEELHTYLPPKDNVHASIAHATQLIEDEVTQKTQQNEAIDYHFYIAALDDFLILQKKPQLQNMDVSVVAHLDLLAKHASGAPSLGKKIGGALLMVAGLFLLTVSIATLVATFGSSSFFSATGIVMGGMLATTAVTGGAFTFFGGRLVNQGRQQGLSKALVTTQEQCQDYYFSTSQLAQ
ncbi:hypothetical protein [Legionella jamestowniensis]|nr:hypothetical protein [Legionella jamestowniensis]